jgi:hypothetical protein
LSSPRTRHLRISLGANESRSPVDGERLFQQPARPNFLLPLRAYSIAFGPPRVVLKLTDALPAIARGVN